MENCMGCGTVLCLPLDSCSVLSRAAHSSSAEGAMMLKAETILSFGGCTHLWWLYSSSRFESSTDRFESSTDPFESSAHHTYDSPLLGSKCSSSDVDPKRGSECTPSSPMRRTSWRTRRDARRHPCAHAAGIKVPFPQGQPCTGLRGQLISSRLLHCFILFAARLFSVA